MAAADRLGGVLLTLVLSVAMALGSGVLEGAVVGLRTGRGVPALSDPEAGLMNANRFELGFPFPSMYCAVGEDDGGFGKIIVQARRSANQTASGQVTSRALLGRVTVQLTGENLGSITVQGGSSSLVSLGGPPPPPAPLFLRRATQLNGTDPLAGAGAVQGVRVIPHSVDVAGLLASSGIYAVLLGPLLITGAWRDRARRRRRNVCLGCGYLLDGLPAGAPCPECALSGPASPAQHPRT